MFQFLHGGLGDLVPARFIALMDSFVLIAVEAVGGPHSQIIQVA
jgi:hypothetical protein